MKKEMTGYIELACDEGYRDDTHEIRLVCHQGKWTQVLTLGGTRSRPLDAALLGEFRGGTFRYPGSDSDDEDRDTETLRLLFSDAAIQAQILIDANLESEDTESSAHADAMAALRLVNFWLINALTQRCKTGRSVDLINNLVDPASWGQSY